MKMTLLAGIFLVAWIGTAFCAESPAPQKTIGINPAYRNLSVKPGDDFEEYANGGWRKTAEIPADRARIGAGFEVFERAEKRTADVDPLNATEMWTENLFGVWVTQALSEPERTVPYLLQGGLGMPDREYYVSDKPEMAKLRTTYRKYVADLLKLAGMSDFVGRAER